MRITRQALAAAAAVGVAAAGGSAFTASNTLPTEAAGQGSTGTAGYTVSAVKYELDSTASRGDYLITTKFSIAPTSGGGNALQVKVRLVTGGDYYSCTRPDAAGAPQAWSCIIASGAVGSGGLQVSTVNTLDVVAVSQLAA